MSLTHRVTQTYMGGSGPTMTTTQSLVGSTEVDLSFLATAGWDGHQIAVTFPHSTVQSFFAQSDQAITLYFNTDGAGVPTVTLAAGIPYIWYTGCGFTNPFSADVTTLYVDNLGVTGANVSIRVLNS